MIAKIDIINKINQKNKNCKINKIGIKKQINVSNISYKYLHTTKIDKKIKNLFSCPPELFPEHVLIENKQYLVSISNKLAKIINFNSEQYRSLKKLSIVEFIAKDCAKKIFKYDKVDIIKYINDEYDFNCFYKKELKILPCLIICELLNLILFIHKQLNIIEDQIVIGANSKRYITSKNYSDAFIYGVFKYNQNVLKFSTFSSVFVDKCVFNLIEKLNLYYKKLQVIVAYIKFFNSNYVS